MEAPLGRGADRPPLSDEPEILERCRAGETAAFAMLVDRYRDRAYGQLVHRPAGFLERGALISTLKSNLTSPSKPHAPRSRER